MNGVEGRADFSCSTCSGRFRRRVRSHFSCCATAYSRLAQSDRTNRWARRGRLRSQHRFRQALRCPNSAGRIASASVEPCSQPRLRNWKSAIRVRSAGNNGAAGKCSGPRLQWNPLRGHRAALRNAEPSRLSSGSGKRLGRRERRSGAAGTSGFESHRRGRSIV